MLIERWQTIVEALGVRRFILISLALVAVRFVGWLNDKLTERGMTALLDIPEWVIWAIVILAFLAYFLLEHAVSLRGQLAPKLSVRFVPGAGSIVRTPNKEYAGGQFVEEREVVIVRGLVESGIRAVTSCMAFLVGVKKKDARSGEFIETEFTESVQLIWSIDAVPETTIPSHIKRFFNVVSIDPKAGQPRLPGPWPLTLRNLFNDKTTYQLDLVVAGEGISSVPMKSEFTWDGTLNVTGRQII